MDVPCAYSIEYIGESILKWTQLNQLLNLNSTTKLLWIRLMVKKSIFVKQSDNSNFKKIYETRHH